MRRQNLSMSFAEIFQAGREARELGEIRIPKLESPKFEVMRNPFGIHKAPAAQFSAECKPPVPARKAMFMRSGSAGLAWEQFQRHAPQWMHFSRSKLGTPFSPG